MVLVCDEESPWQGVLAVKLMVVVVAVRLWGRDELPLLDYFYYCCLRFVLLFYTNFLCWLEITMLRFFSD